MPRRNLSLSERKKICLDSDFLSPQQLAAAYKISERQIYRIIGRKEYIISICEKVNTKLTRIRHDAVDIDHDAKVVAFIEEFRENGLPVNVHTVMREAARLKGLDKSTMPSGWWQHFRIRNNITSATLCGELLSSNFEAAEEFKKYVIPELLHDNTNCELWNFDETRLFWKLMPSKTYAKKGTRRHGMSKFKDAVTIAFLVSCSGLKMKPIVIGKHAKPQWFRKFAYDNSRSPVDYYATESAFINQYIFERIISKWHQQLLDQHEKALLILDNASSHTKIDMTKYPAITLKFLPPRTTALTQPLDQGIIRAFKARYISKLIDYMIVRFEATHKPKDVLKSISFLNAVDWCSKAWDEISKVCISNCWRKCGFARNDGDMPVILIDDDDVYEDELSERFQNAACLFNDSIDYESYIQSIESRYR